MTIERRKDERSDCALDGRIETDDRLIFDCIVRDLSVTGARLLVEPETALPDTFDLLVPVLPGTDQRLGTKLIWRRAEEVGVEFIRRPDQGGTAVPPPHGGNPNH